MRARSAAARHQRSGLGQASDAAGKPGPARRAGHRRPDADGFRRRDRHAAKAFGIKTGTLVRDARRLCPAVVPVHANHRLYTDYHERILKAQGF